MSRLEAIKEALKRFRGVQRREPGFRQIAEAVHVVSEGEHSVGHCTIRLDMKKAGLR